MKKSIAIIFVLIMAISTLANAQGSAVFTVEPFVNEGIVSISISYTDNWLMQSGGFDLIYDNSKLKYKSLTKSEVLEKTLNAINEEFRENAIRIAWVSTELMPKEGKIITYEFELISGKFENTDISIDNFSIGNKNGQNLKECSIKIQGVDNSTIYSGDYGKNNQNVTDKPATSEPAQTQEPTDETLPVDKAEGEGEAAEEATLAFEDVKAEDWFFESVNYAKENGLMSGVSSTEFAPEESVTRAMLVVVLHRLEGTPPPAKSSGFADVVADEWYTAGIAWAAEKGIVNGVEDDKFAPDAQITREQIAAIMHRYAVYKGYDVSVGESTNILSYDDVDKVSEYAIAPVQWAVGSGLVKGKTASTLNPEDNATRAEIAVILHRFIEANTK